MVKAMAHRPITATLTLNTRAANVSRQKGTIAMAQRRPWYHTHQSVFNFENVPFPIGVGSD